MAATDGDDHAAGDGGTAAAPAATAEQAGAARAAKVRAFLAELQARPVDAPPGEGDTPELVAAGHLLARLGAFMVDVALAGDRLVYTPVRAWKGVGLAGDPQQSGFATTSDASGGSDA